MGAIGKMAGILLHFKARKLLASHGTFQRQARLTKIIIAQVYPCCAGFQLHRKALDRRSRRHHPGAGAVGSGLFGPGEHRLVITEYQQVPIGRMLEVVVDAHLGAQTLNERQISLAELHAVLARWISTAQAKLKAVAQDALPDQHQRHNLRHTFVLKNTLMTAVRQVLQMRHKTDLITRQAPPRLALPDSIDQAMHTMPLLIEPQIGLAMQQAFQIEIGLFADQFKVDTVRLTQRLLTLEAVDLEVAGNPIQGQVKRTLIGRSEHPVFLCEG